MEVFDMTNNKMFAAFNKQTAKSFNDQKALIKKVLAGRVILCNTCQQPLHFLSPSEKEDTAGRIRCNKGCTDIELDIV